MKMLEFIRALMVLSAIFAHNVKAEDMTKALERVENELKLGHMPVAVFDLDETLISSHARKLLSYREAVKTLTEKYPIESKQVQEELSVYNFRNSTNGYDMHEIFLKAGIQNDAFIKELDLVALPIYLSNKFMDFDSEVSCATFFIRELQLKGVFVYFVSSRFKDTQSLGTFNSLKQIGMVKEGDKYEIILRERGVSSIDFKTNTFRKIASQNVVLAFENEPENLNAMGDWFKNADLYFVLGSEMKHEPFKIQPTILHDFCI